MQFIISAYYSDSYVLKSTTIEIIIKDFRLPWENSKQHTSEETTETMLAITFYTKNSLKIENTQYMNLQHDFFPNAMWNALLAQ